MNALTLVLVGSLLWLAPAAGYCVKVYKWIDEQGNVVYSDTPRPGAIEIDIPTEPAGIVPVPAEKLLARERSPARPASYGALIVASPGDEQIIADPEGTVSVSLALEPPLRVSDGDAIRLKLDGQALETRYTSGDIAIPSVPRGAHTLQAEVVNPAGAVLIASAPVKFYVQAPSALAPAGPDIYDPAVPGQPYPPTYKPVYPPQPYSPQGRPKR